MKKILKIITILISICYSFLYANVFDMGLSYFLDAKYDLSEVMFKKSYLINEISSSHVDFYLAYCLYLNDKIESARKLYKKLSNNLPKDDILTIYSNLMYAECCALLDLYEEAISIYDNILKTLSVPYEIIVSAYYGKIYCLYKLKKYNETLIAISLFKSFLNKEKISPKKAIEEQIDYILADCWYQKGNYKKAFETFKNFTDKYNDSDLFLHANFKLFLICEAQKNYKDAEQVLKLLEEKVTSSDLSNIIKYNLAKILVKQKKINQAIKIYQQILSSANDPNFKQYVELELSFCFFQQGNFSKAIEVLNKINSNKEEININKHYLLGICYLSNKNYKEAINTFSKFLKSYPNSIKWIDDATYWLGISYYKSKQYSKAIQTFSLLKNKKSSTYYLAACLYMAKSYKETKEYELAKLILSSLLENERRLTETSIGVILYELAENYKLSYDFQTALQYLKKILEKNIKDDYLIYSTKISIAEIYNYLNNYEESEKILSELINKQKNLTEDLILKTKLLYLTVKNNLSKTKEAENIAWELLNLYSNKLSIEENRYIINILSKIYSNNGNFARLIEVLEKLSGYVTNSEEKFLLDLRILRIANLMNDYNKLYSKIIKIQKENKTYPAIVDYYLSKYYLATNNVKNFLQVLLKFNTYSAESYKHFTYKEFLDLLSICSENSDVVTMHLCENILPYLNFEPQQKVDLIKNVIENFLAKREYQKIVRLSSLIKKISNDSFTSSYSEFIIAKVYELTGKLNWAENIYKEIIEKYPNSPIIPKVYLSLIKYYKNKNEGEKIKYYEELLIGKYPDSKETYEWLYEKSQLFIAESKYLEAIELLKKLTNSKDFAPTAQKLIADCYFNLGKYKEASIEYLRVIYLYPDRIDLSSEAQFMVGLCAEKLNLYNEAKKAYTTSKEKYPGTLWAQEADFRLKRLR